MPDRAPRPLRDLPDATAPQLLDALVASIADAVYVADPAGDIAYVNRAALDLLGFTDESELLGRPSHATIHHRRPDGSPYPERDCPLLRPRTTGETVRVDEWFVRVDDTMVEVDCSSAPVELASGRGAVVVFRDVTDRRAAEESLRHREVEQAQAAEVRASRARLVHTADEQRRRFGRDLHDGAQQRLVHVVIDLQRAVSRLPPGSPAAEPLEAALAQTRGAIADLRELAAGLDPAILTNKGLRAAIESLTVRSPFAVTIDIPGTRFPHVQETTAYYVIAEALTNAAKHANASAARATVLAPGDGSLVVEVSDDGAGGADLTRGTGLVGLADRVTAQGGTLTVDSPAGGGTRLRAVLPAAA